MKNKIMYLTIAIVLVALGVFVYVFYGREAPTIGTDGKIIGNYSIGGIMALGKPYECSFSKSDGSSQVSGLLRMEGGRLRGDFDLNIATSSFASHFIIASGTAYSWTSLGPIGYKNPVAKSTSKNTSPIDQAQIIGLKDKENYSCSPWEPVISVFDIPSGISFLELKN